MGKDGPPGKQGIFGEMGPPGTDRYSPGPPGEVGPQGPIVRSPPPQPAACRFVRCPATTSRHHPVFFFFTLVTGPRSSLSLALSAARVYEP